MRKPSRSIDAHCLMNVHAMCLRIKARMTKKRYQTNQNLYNFGRGGSGVSGYLGVEMEYWG